MATLKSLTQKVKAEAIMSNKPAPEGFTPGTNAWRVRLSYQGRNLTVDFFTGPLAGEPDAEGVLDCLLSDVSAGEQSFEDFCSEFGYDEDSRKAERTWKACGALAPKVRRLLGEDFDTFCYAER